MKRMFVFASTAALLMSAGASSAADMAVKARPMAAPPPPCTWCGFYVGLNGGYGWGDTTGNLVANSGGLFIPPAIAGGTIPSGLGVRSEGWVAGGQAGYNWQLNQFVFGVEADIQGSGIEESVFITRAAVPALGLVATQQRAKSELDWFGTVRGRLGIAWSSVLLYATGGFAYGGVGNSVTSSPDPFTLVGRGSVSSTLTGWTAGAGFEWAFTPNWSFKGEYLHIDLGNATATALFPATTDFLAYRFKHEYDIARVGFNYRFNTAAPVVAKY